MKLSWTAWLRFILFILLVNVLTISLTGSQLASAWASGDPARRWAWGFAALLWAVPFARLIFFRQVRANHLQTVALVMMGVAATLFFLLLIVWLLHWPLAWAGIPLWRWTPWWALGLALLMNALGLQNAFAQAQTLVRRIPIQGLHPGLEGLRIVQISDLHVSHLIGAARVQHLVAQVEALEPDLIAVTGDLVDGPLRDLKAAVQPLAGLKAPLGVHYVTGNHEYFWGVDSWLEEFGGLGFELLTNAHRVLEHQGAKVLVVGVNDPTAHRLGSFEGPDLARAQAGAPQADFTLFLAHQPVAYELAEEAGADLFLAGHTHGGQFFPFSLIIGLFHKYAVGLYKHSAKLWVYVHTGSGFWGPPNRLGRPPEIAVLQLEKA
jgi:predicted MPP superfamily phosphohydrolase